jgi:pyruvate dehydrogenase E2 component (dihydrolipoamide acetyltransferase)
MPVEFKMPQLSTVDEEVTILTWLKQEGDEIKEGEPLVEVETSKAVVTLEAPTTGILKRIYFREGEKVPVGTVIALIMLPGEEMPQEPARPERRRIKASPAAKALAAEMGIDLSLIKGTGPNGRIVVEDVKRALAAKETQITVPSIEKAREAIRRSIAEKLSAAWQSTPRVTLFARADATALVKLRKLLNEEAERLGKVSISFNDLLVKITALQLKRHPYMNVRFSPEKVVEQMAEINIGIAVHTSRGLLVPVIKNADKKTIWQIAEESRALEQAARDGTITPANLEGSTFTITNLGMYKVEFFTPIINPPECAILGVGVIQEIPAVVNGQVVPQLTLPLSLVFDHRLVDGAPAAEFLLDLIKSVEVPFLDEWV